jgi:acyl-coenzyme A thioesterase PaaI-like protein
MPANRLARTLQPLERLPTALRARARSLVMGQIVPFVGTARLRIEELSDRRAVVSVQNRRRVQNHLHTVHAAAMALIAETASGFVVGMNVPDDRVPVIKSMRVDFLKRARGAMRAVAELTDEQRAAIAREQKGEVAVQVRVEDGEGKEPIACAMIWAWTPKRR